MKKMEELPKWESSEAREKYYISINQKNLFHHFSHLFFPILLHLEAIKRFLESGREGRTEEYCQEVFNDTFWENLKKERKKVRIIYDRLEEDIKNNMDRTIFEDKNTKISLKDLLEKIGEEDKGKEIKQLPIFFGIFENESNFNDFSQKVKESYDKIKEAYKETKKVIQELIQKPS